MNSGDWMNDIEQAHDFKRGVDAVEFVKQHNLKNVELVYAFPDPRYDFSITKF